MIPSRRLKCTTTVQLSLKQKEEDLLKGTSEEHQSILKQALLQNFELMVNENPSDLDLKDFQRFYNGFAKRNKLTRLDNKQLKTLKLLRDKEGIILTKLLNTEGEELCYQLYIVNGQVAMSQYMAVTAMKQEEMEEEIEYANYYLLWKNILMFRRRGYAIYDMGYLTGDEKLSEFKLGFGGEKVDVYSGYLTSSSMIGKLINLQWYS